MLSKRAYLVKEKQFDIREEELIINDDQALIQMKFCGLCNWELNHWKGTAEEYRSNYPFVPGHEWVGIVVEVGKNVTKVQVGDAVTGLGMGGFAEYRKVNPKECHKIAPNTPLVNAIGEPLKCVVTVLRAAKPEAGDFGLVLGCGPMGLWCTQGLDAKLLGGLIAVDVDDAKLELAKKYGATHTINSKREDVAQAVHRITNGRNCDFVIEGTGIPKLLNEGMNYLRKAGRLILMSSHEDSCPEFDFRPAIARGITIHVPHPSSCANEQEEMKRALALINRGTFHNEDIVTHRFKLDEIHKAFDILEHKPKDYIKGVIEF